MSTIDIVIPVLNEELALPRCIAILKDYLRENINQPWTITIVDNGSEDKTLSIAEDLGTDDDQIHASSLPTKGRGRALRSAWLRSSADIVCYMDVDLSTQLTALPKLLQAIECGYDIAIGSRLASESKVTRSFRRQAISRIYNAILRFVFGFKITDAQCGFKALSRKASQNLIPLVENNNWFFDSELLIVGYINNQSIAEIPVEWIEDSDTRVKITTTVIEDLLGILRLKLTGVPRINLKR